MSIVGILVRYFLFCGLIYAVCFVEPRWQVERALTEFRWDTLDEYGDPIDPRDIIPASLARRHRELVEKHYHWAPPPALNDAFSLLKSYQPVVKKRRRRRRM